MSSGRTDSVSLGSKIRNSVSLVFVVDVYERSVFIGYFDGYFLVSGSRFPHSSNSGRVCTVPDIGWSLLKVIDAWMVLFDCAGIVCLLAVLLGMDSISSGSVLVICIFGNFFPCVFSRIVECLRKIASQIIGNDLLV